MEENLKKISTMKNLLLGYDTEENLIKLSRRY